MKTKEDTLLNVVGCHIISLNKSESTHLIFIQWYLSCAAFGEVVNSCILHQGGEDEGEAHEEEEVKGRGVGDLGNARPTRDTDGTCGEEGGDTYRRRITESCNIYLHPILHPHSIKDKFTAVYYITGWICLGIG